MRLVVLTTETPHHVRFVQEIGRAFSISTVLVETSSLAAPFPTRHPFEDQRDAHERALWFGQRDLRLADVSECECFPSINDAEAVARLRQLAPDVVITFGTGRLKPAVIEVAPAGIINLHGGDPEHYRGLDTHLWAVWHGDFGGLVTALHRLNAELDDGDILERAAVPLRPGMKLHELRAANTETCIELTRRALERRAAQGSFQAAPQLRRGRYYSFMPAVLKDLCVGRFERYTAKL